MKNKVCVNLMVPVIEESYNIFIPVNKKTIEIIFLLNKAINNITDNSFPITDKLLLIEATTGSVYDVNKTVKENNILNGATLILL